MATEHGECSLHSIQWEALSGFWLLPVCGSHCPLLRWGRMEEKHLKWKVRPQINVPVRHPRGAVKSRLIQEMTPEAVAAGCVPSALEGPGLLF